MVELVGTSQRFAAPDIGSNATDVALPSPGRFRRRLTLAFVLVAVATATVFGLTSALLVRSYRVNSFNQRGRREARLALLAAPRDLSAPAFSRLLAEYETRGGFDTVAVARGVEYSSSTNLTLANVPPSVAVPPRGRISALATTHVG